MQTLRKVKEPQGFVCSRTTETLKQLIVLGTSVLELANPLEVLLLSMDALIELQLSLTVVLSTLVELLHTGLFLLRHNASDVLQVVEEDLTLLFLF